MKTTSQTFNISFPSTLVQEIDAAASTQFASRSDFLRSAALQYLRNEKEWNFIFREGKKICTQDQLSTEATALQNLTQQRRASGRWHVSAR